MTTQKNGNKRLASCISGRVPVAILLLIALFAVPACEVTVDSDSSELSAQRSDIPRTPSGHPDFNGIWQALGNTHWDIEPHMASAALAVQAGPMGPVPATEVLAFGAVGAIPSGQGIVVGGLIPYLPEALKQKRENQANWLARDPEVRCYLPGVPR
ncbi:MAG: hypothetical protein O7B81_12505, partial [Gammaproteobacteria bacterium]|nr:hypothetical protein [Gammaproteobacteria bacterium]